MNNQSIPNPETGEKKEALFAHSRGMQKQILESEV
jgi:hypothetical protein